MRENAHNVHVHMEQVAGTLGIDHDDHPWLYLLCEVGH